MNLLIRKKTIIFFLLIVGIISFSAFILHHPAAPASQANAMPAITVTTAKAQQQTWNDRLTAVGTVKAFHGVAISPAVSGSIVEIYFKSGEEVKAGQLLLELECRDLQALLANHQAKLELAQSNYQRYMQLSKNHYVAMADIDRVRSELQQAQAEVKQNEAQVAQHHIRAPFSGKLGLSQIDLGQYVSPGQTLVTLETLTPIFVDFNLPEKYSGHIHVGDEVHFFTKAVPAKAIPGRIVAISPEVDANTRNLTVRAQTDNADETLLPGMFANVNLNLDNTQSTIVIPQTAIKYGPEGAAVYIIKDRKAHLQIIKIGQLKDDFASVSEGIKINDEVVIAGQNKLHENALIAISQ